MFKETDRHLRSFVKKLEKLVTKYGKTIMLEQISKVIDISTNHSHVHDNPLEYTSNCCCSHECSDEELVKRKHEEFHHKH